MKLPHSILRSSLPASSSRSLRKIVAFSTGLLGVTSVSCVLAREIPITPPATLLWSGDSLASAKAAFLAKDPDATRAVQTVLKEADGEMANEPVSIVAVEGGLAASGDPQDYFSVGPYWWPNPDTANGLPWIRRDGQVNPEAFKGRRRALSRTATAIRRLSLAWYFSDDDRYAAHAAAILRTWFIMPETRMNPSFRYAQAVPGLNDGRPIGMIEAVRLLDVIDGIRLLQTGSQEPALAASDQVACQAWFSDLLTWCLDSKVGKDTGKAKNNIGTWYYAQIGAYAVFTGRASAVRSIYEQRLPAIAREQITPDGRQHRELARTRPMGYSAYNLTAWLNIVGAGRDMGVDYWNPSGLIGGRLHAALHYLANYAPVASVWPHPELKQTPQREQLTPLFLHARSLDRSHFISPVTDAALAHLSKAFPADAWVQLTYGHFPGEELTSDASQGK